MLLKLVFLDSDIGSDVVVFSDSDVASDDVFRQ